MRNGQGDQTLAATSHFDERTIAMSSRDLTATRLRTLVHYDPNTGIFIWLKKTNRRIKNGAEAGWMADGYRHIAIDGHNQKAHRLAWLYVHGVWPSQDVDHIDGNRSNNAIANLRDVSRAVNIQNQRIAKPRNQSGYLGVAPTGTPGRWSAQVHVAGKKHHLGCYGSPEEAHAAYVAGKRRLHEGNTL